MNAGALRPSPCDDKPTPNSLQGAPPPHSLTHTITLEFNLPDLRAEQQTTPPKTQVISVPAFRSVVI